MTRPFVPPTYPFDLLAPIALLAEKHEGGMVDLSIGTPCDAPPPAVVEALASSGSERGYPPGVGSARLLGAARDWVERRFGVVLERGQLAACVGTKELVAGIPQWLKLRSPERDVVLYPALAYPTYEMGALLAGVEAVPVPLRFDGTLDLAAVSEEHAGRALCLWVNSPSNPTGALDDLGAIAAWGRARGVPVLSDECYAEFTWEGRPQTILQDGLQGVLAIHSISKRSNAAGLRCGFYAGDPELVHYLAELRRHAGFMVPGPIQAAAAVALGDDEHVERQRQRYRRRLERFIAILGAVGVEAKMPGGSFYLWVAVDDGSTERLATAVGGTSRRADVAGGADTGGREVPEPPAWAFTRAFAELGGVLVSPGAFYGPGAGDHVRVALVQPDERLELVGRRLGVS